MTKTNCPNYCIACSVLPDIMFKAPSKAMFDIQQFRRHDRQACHQANLKRVYLFDGKPVAVNRHKATEQKNDSLEEYRNTHSEKDVSLLTVTEHFPRYKRQNRWMPGSLLSYEGHQFVMQKSSGFHNGKPDYYVAINGDKFNASKCIIIQNNKGLSVS